jgi:hypothetical protein
LVCSGASRKSRLDLFLPSGGLFSGQSTDHLSHFGGSKSPYSIEQLLDEDFYPEDE